MKIKGGCILIARKIDESAIANKPPHFREIWNWLLRQANHSENGKFKRGQCLRSFKDIQEGLKWYVGYRKETYSKDQCEKAMKFLRGQGMIATTKATRGLFITILNYDTYQSLLNYESDKKATTKATRKQQHCDTINKNDKELKNENIYTPSFEQVWILYPNRVGRKNAEKHFRSSVKRKKDFEDIKSALDNYKNHLSNNTWKKPQNGSTWFNNWKDWIEWDEDSQEIDWDGVNFGGDANAQ